MTSRSVDALLDDIRLLGAEHHEVVAAVRALVRKCFAPLTEEVKYGGILFGCGVTFCGVFAYKEHVSVEFGYGAAIDDPFGHLEGAGKLRRHVKLVSVADIQTKELARYLTLALEAAQRAT